MSRRSDNPLTILVIGIVILCGFGVSLVLLTDKTPVLQLKPLIEKEFKVELRARFRPPGGTTPPAIELILEKQEDSPPKSDAALATWALGKYLELVKETDVGTTTIQQLEIRVEGALTSRYVLTLRQFHGKARAEASIKELTEIAERAGFREVKVEVLGYARTGARLSVSSVFPGQKRRTRTMVRRAVLKFQGLEYVGSVEFEVRGPEPLKLVGGRDTPMRRSNPPGKRPRRRPGSSATPAPVDSQGR